MADKKKKDEELLLNDKVQAAGNAVLNLANSMAGNLGAVGNNPVMKAALDKANTSFADNTAKASNTDLTPKAPTLEQPVKPTAFSYNPYVESEAVKAAQANMGKYSNGFTPDANYDALMAQYQQMYGNRPANFNFTKQAQMDDYFNQLLNRKDFEYDLNGDMLYQQYKDRYIQQGQQAMMDTMGQAQAMTGGYGNSYAQQAGQQAYQGYLQGLNDRIPELYNLALQRYQMEGDKLQNAYNMLGNERNFAYGQYQDELVQWNNDVNRALNIAQDERNFQRSSFDADRANAQDMYFNLANQDYGRYADAYNRAIQQYAQDMADYQWQSQFNEGVRQSDIDNALRQAQFDETVKQNTIGNEQWQKTFDEGVRQADMDEALNRAKLDQSQSQFEANMSEEQRQFDENMGEKQREFDVSMAEDRRQFDRNYNLSSRKLAESTAGVSSSGNTGGTSISPEDSKVAQTIRENIGTQEQFNIETTGNSQGSGTRRAYKYNGKEYTNFKEYATQYVIDAYNAGYIDDNELAYLLNHYGVQFEFKK